MRNKLEGERRYCAALSAGLLVISLISCSILQPTPTPVTCVDRGTVEAFLHGLETPLVATKTTAQITQTPIPYCPTPQAR